MKYRITLRPPKRVFHSVWTPDSGVLCRIYNYIYCLKAQLKYRGQSMQIFPIFSCTHHSSFLIRCICINNENTIFTHFDFKRSFTCWLTPLRWWAMSLSFSFSLTSSPWITLHLPSLICKELMWCGYDLMGNTIGWFLFWWISEFPFWHVAKLFLLLQINANFIIIWGY